MKKITFLVLFFISTGNCFSQPIFSKRYNIPVDFASLIDAAPDGGYYFSGEMNNDLIVGKIDSMGNLQWAKQIEYPLIALVPHDMVVLNNGNVVIAVFFTDYISIVHVYLVSFDLTGNLVFSKKYENLNGSTLDVPNNIIKDGNGFCIAVRTEPSGETHFLKADSAGNKLSNSFILWSYWHIFKNYAGNYILYQDGNEIALLDSSFNLQTCIWTDLTPNSNTGMLEISNGSYIIYGYMDVFVAKINAQLEYEWQKFFEIPNLFIGKIAAAQKIDTNKIAFFGLGEASGQKPYVFVLDTMGNLLNCKVDTTDGFNWDVAQGKCVFKNKRFTFLYNELIPSLGTFLKINSVDTTFSQICNLVDTTMIIGDDDIYPGGTLTNTTGIANDSLVPDSLLITNITFANGDCNDSILFVNQIKNQKENITIAPNPATNNFTITFPNTINKGVIEIYNVLGEKIFKEDVTNVSQKEIHIKNIVAGIYFVKVKVYPDLIGNGEKEYEKKLVIQ